MKRVFALVLIIVMTFAFTACGSKSSEDSDSKSDKKTAIDVSEGDTVYTFHLDEWKFYVASMLSDSTIKVEKWSRFTADDETPFEYEKDVITITLDEENKDGFYWVDKGQTAFYMNLGDPDEERLAQAPSVPFTKTTNKNISSANYSDTIYYYNYDKWNMYVASKLSDSIIKVEKWNRFIADDETPFVYNCDTRVINTEDSSSSDFTWVDDKKAAFTLTLQDGSVEGLVTGVKQTFTLNSEFTKEYKLLSYTLPATSFSEGNYTKPKTAHVNITEVKATKKDYEEESEGDESEEKEDGAVFTPKDVSDETIESIETYADYLAMFQKITDDYLANYEKAIKGTALYDEESFESMKKDYANSYQEQLDQYGSMKNDKLIGKESLVDYLKSYRDGLKEYTDNLADNLN